MVNLIKLKRGLNIKLQGEAELIYGEAIRSETFFLVPDDFYGVTPKLAVREGDLVKAGSVVFFDKNHPELKIVSPVSGVVKAINRGERRKIMSIDITADKTIDYEKFEKIEIEKSSSQQIKEALLNAGLFAFIKQRPFDIIANPNLQPKAIFISCFDSAPLAPDYNFILSEKMSNFQLGVNALAKIADVHLGVKSSATNIFNDVKGAKTTAFEGPHPAGNVGVQIHHVNPINKDEIVWVLNPADVVLIGNFINTGIVDLSRVVVLAGSEVKNPLYVKTIYGASLSSIINGNITKERKLRYINGNPLSGIISSEAGALAAFAHQITIIPEGDDVDEMFGWIAPRFNQFSVSRSYFSWLRNLFCKQGYRIDARIKGGERHMIASGEYDKVFPMDIYPEFLLKAIFANDIDKMEALGIYEVAPEDFALCEFVCSSKVEVQKIVRQGLDGLYNEMN